MPVDPLDALAAPTSAASQGLRSSSHVLQENFILCPTVECRIAQPGVRHMSTTQQVMRSAVASAFKVQVLAAELSFIVEVHRDVCVWSALES
ncbi:hypothetical protein L596_000797 [Steinernema carpocapsae]|uniref:Uncharacterized protein n=1 Tax=Steinernema carpocapsae TaxID=34508 RepID=A0A4V6I766_STECR|nr:hypothetical protein L596_000797 [Steinernema carpocapsae]